MTTWSTLLRPSGTTLRWMLLAILLAMVTIVAGALLLGVSGWLIAASAMAGLGLIGMIDIFVPGAAIRAFAVGRTVARYLERLISHHATLGQLADLRVHSVKRLLQRSPEALDSMKNGDTLSRLTRDVDTLDHVFPKLILPAITALACTFLAVLAYGWLHARLAWITLLVYALVIPLVLWVAGKTSAVSGQALARIGPEVRAHLVESLAGLRTLSSIGQVAPRFDEVSQRNRAFVQHQLDLRRVEAIAHGLVAMLAYCGVWLLFLSALQLLGQGLLSGPIVVVLVLSSLALVDLWLPLANGWLFLATCRASADRIDQLGQAGQDADVITASSAAVNIPTSYCTDGHPDFSIRNLCFRYQPWGDPVIAGLNLDLTAGQRILIGGASGCGKTTLGKLLAGLLTPSSGVIEFEGMPLTRRPGPEVRSRIGYLAQQTVLFNDSLANNLRLARAGASDDELREVLDIVQLSPLLEQLPDGLDTWLGESGLSVSGGEARRIALARLLLGPFDCLILDEPMAGLDDATAGVVAAALDPFLRGRTVLMLSHERSHLPGVDRTLSMSQGLLLPSNE